MDFLVLCNVNKMRHLLHSNAILSSVGQMRFYPHFGLDEILLRTQRLSDLHGNQGWHSGRLALTVTCSLSWHCRPSLKFAYTREVTSWCPQDQFGIQSWDTRLRPNSNSEISSNKSCGIETGFSVEPRPCLHYGKQLGVTLAWMWWWLPH